MSHFTKVGKSTVCRNDFEVLLQISHIPLKNKIKYFRLISISDVQITFSKFFGKTFIKVDVGGALVIN